MWMPRSGAGRVVAGSGAILVVAVWHVVPFRASACRYRWHVLPFFTTLGVDRVSGG